MSTTQVFLSIAYHWICPRCWRGNVESPQIVDGQETPPAIVTCGGCGAQFRGVVPRSCPDPQPPAEVEAHGIQA